MLLDERPFDLHQPGWAYEIKFDGYRLMAAFGQGKCELKTRGGANATAWFPEIMRPLSNVKLCPEGPYVVDGEFCVMDEMGRSDFDRLHVRAKQRCFYGGCDPVTFCVFDLLVANGVDQAQLPYLERKDRLQRLFKPTPAGILYVGHFESKGELLYNGAVLPLELEGLVAKRMDSPHEPDDRSIHWGEDQAQGRSPRRALQIKTMTLRTMTPISPSHSLPFLEVPAISRFQDCAGIDVVAVDETSLTFELQGPSSFLRQAEKVLMRSSNEALLDGQAIVLRRSTWTQPIGPVKLQVSCRYARTAVGD